MFSPFYKKILFLMALGILVGGAFYAYQGYQDLAASRTPAAVPEPATNQGAGANKRIQIYAPATPQNRGLKVAVPSSIKHDRESWSMEPSPAGYPARVTNFKMRSGVAVGNVWQASQDFLAMHGRDVFRVDPQRLKLLELKPGQTAKDMKKVIYEQEIDGIPVINSRLALFYLGDGTLHEVQANIVPEGTDIDTKELLTAEAAARLAREALQKTYAAVGESAPPQFSQARLVEIGRYAIYLDASGHATPAYQYLVVAPNPSRKAGGEREIIVDASHGQVVVDRQLARN